ncbi:SGNH/GDSL hydrolase family protein [Reichenbachiella versicolor]|uniref:SGNH/GDSL hydrolase family protein n=1 Tax=Reichenbachiella versicolor TaxID=1821036 RepID=UPI000D6E84C0|nr:SGNH/GDSL hydrolase family protein [Reichenbachiella versicolor]
MNVRLLKQSLMLLVTALVSLTTEYALATDVSDPSTTQELRVRSGLPNFFSKIGQQETLRVGFIGGSITAGEDDKWSGKVFNWFKEQYPDQKFEKYNIAVPGTPAPFGAFRTESKLLVHQPDLVFIEYRVNGLGGQGIKGPEGMVRQIRSQNPHTDICFVYTISKNMIESIRNGKQTSVGKVLEQTANYYDIPTIDMGIEVVKLLDEDKLVFQSNTAVDGKITFTKDGTHPLEAGAEIYKDVVVRSLSKMSDNKTTLKHPLPKAIDGLSFESATIHTVNEVKKSKKWTAMDPNTDEIYRSARWRSEFVVGEALKTDKTGQTITFEWEGYALAMSTLPQGTGMAIEVSTDGKPAKEFTFERQGKDRYGSYLFYAPFLDNGKHTTTVKVTKLPNSSVYYFGQFYTVKKK